MPKYLWKGNYTPEGARGLRKEGGTARVKAVDDLVRSAGGKVEAYYYAFGEHDAYLIVDLPSNAAAVAVSMAIATAGVTKIQTIPLLTMDEVDKAAEMPVKYRPPGT